MGSFTPPNIFQPEEVQLLQQAFDATWAEMITHNPGRDDNDLRVAISERLCDRPRKLQHQNRNEGWQAAKASRGDRSQQSWKKQ
jgi:hypothetical protein